MIEEKIILGIPIDTKQEFYYYPIKYKDFLEIGETEYYMLLDFLKSAIDPLPIKNKLYNVLLSSSSIEIGNGITLLYLLLKFLKIILNVEEININKNKYLLCDGILINNKNFDIILNIALKEYDLIFEKEDEKKYNPKDKKAEKIIEKLNKTNEKIEKQKNLNSEDDKIHNKTLLLKTCFDLKISPKEFQECSAAYCKKMLEITYKQTVLNAAFAGANMEKIKMKDLF
jgi:hypothetical protein